MIWSILAMIVCVASLALLGWAARQSWEKMPVEPPAPTPFSRSQEANAEAARAYDAARPQVRQVRLSRRDHYSSRQRKFDV